VQDLIKAGFLRSAPSQANLVKILERHAVALRCKKGSSMRQPLKLRRTLTEGNGATEKCQAAVNILVTGEVDITLVGDGVGEIGGIDDIYEKKNEDYGDEEERVLTHDEVSQLQLEAPAAAAPAS